MFPLAIRIIPIKSRFGYVLSGRVPVPPKVVKQPDMSFTINYQGPISPSYTLEHCLLYHVHPPATVEPVFCVVSSSKFAYSISTVSGAHCQRIQITVCWWNKLFNFGKEDLHKIHGGLKLYIPVGPQDTKDVPVQEFENWIIILIELEAFHSTLIVDVCMYGCIR